MYNYGNLVVLVSSNVGSGKDEIFASVLFGCPSMEGGIVLDE